MNRSPTIVWFHRDLRLSDHEALSWAAARGPVIPLYIRDDSPTEGGASKWWLHGALKSLGQDFAKRKISLVLKRGDPLKILLRLIEETKADAVVWSRRYEAALSARDHLIASHLSQLGIEVSVKPGFLLFEPENIKTKAGTFFKVYTPFSKACFSAPAPLSSLPVPTKIARDNRHSWRDIGIVEAHSLEGEMAKGVGRSLDRWRKCWAGSSS